VRCGQRRTAHRLLCCPAQDADKHAVLRGKTYKVRGLLGLPNPAFPGTRAAHSPHESLAAAKPALAWLPVAAASLIAPPRLTVVQDLYRDLRTAVDMCHRDGSLKRAVAANPEHFMHRDEHLIDVSVLISHACHSGRAAWWAGDGCVSRDEHRFDLGRTMQGAACHGRHAVARGRPSPAWHLCAFARHAAGCGPGLWAADGEARHAHAVLTHRSRPPHRSWRRSAPAAASCSLPPTRCSTWVARL
jgi:hypothetical protein